MAKLIVSLDGQLVKEYEIKKERLTIGRKPHNDIQIDNLAVSGEHAMIMTILNDSFLEDLGSTNGTLVNGQPVKKHFLQDKDVVEIGKYKLKYVNEQPSKMTQQEFEKTMVLRAPATAPKPKDASDTQTSPRFSDTSVESAGGRAAALAQASPPAPAAPQTASQPSPAPQPAPAAQPATPQPASQPAAAGQGTIQILSGPNAGKELPLSKPLTTVGKPGVQVAVIAKRPQGYFITHVEGATFPTVNGKALDAQARQLHDHDVIELAGVKMEFFIKS